MAVRCRPAPSNEQESADIGAGRYLVTIHSSPVGVPFTVRGPRSSGPSDPYGAATMRWRFLGLEEATQLREPTCYFLRPIANTQQS